MLSARPTVLRSMIALATVFCVALSLSAAPPAAAARAKTNLKEKAAAKKKSDDQKRVSVEVARKRAKLMHNIYAATLDVIHHRYFRADRSAIPARAMEDVFSEIARQENIKANWIAVNSRAMSIDHEPKEGFEKQAAKAIAAGKGDYEKVERGIFRRAQGISLNNRGCLGCHLGFGATGTKKRFAGLVISIPVKED